MNIPTGKAIFIHWKVPDHNLCMTEAEQYNAETKMYLPYPLSMKSRRALRKILPNRGKQKDAKSEHWQMAGVDLTRKQCPKVWEIPEENHSHSWDGGWTGTTQVMRLENEVDVWTKLNALSTRHSQQPVIIKDGVEWLNPLWINVTIAYDPGMNINSLSHHLPCTVGQNAVRPLASVHVNMAKQLHKTD